MRFLSNGTFASILMAQEGITGWDMEMSQVTKCLLYALCQVLGIHRRQIESLPLGCLESGAVVPKLQHTPVHKDGLLKQRLSPTLRFSGDVGVVSPGTTL